VSSRRRACRPDRRLARDPLTSLSKLSTPILFSATLWSFLFAIGDAKLSPVATGFTRRHNFTGVGWSMRETIGRLVGHHRCTLGPVHRSVDWTSKLAWSEPLLLDPWFDPPPAGLSRPLDQTRPAGLIHPDGSNQAGWFDPPGGSIQNPVVQSLIRPIQFFWWVDPRLDQTSRNWVNPAEALP